MGLITVAWQRPRPPPCTHRKCGGLPVRLTETVQDLVSCGALEKFPLVREQPVNQTELTDDNGRPTSVG
jgi:hypothetical protein